LAEEFKMNEIGNLEDKSTWIIGGTTLIGVGVGFIFLTKSVFIFIASILIGIGAGLALTPIFSKR
jgi:hypothetical protein